MKRILASFQSKGGSKESSKLILPRATEDIQRVKDVLLMVCDQHSQHLLTAAGVRRLLR